MGWDKNSLRVSSNMADLSYYFISMLNIYSFLKIVSGYDYLIAVPADSRGTHSTIYFQAGPSGGLVQVQHPHQSRDGHLLLDNGRHIELIGAKMGVVSGVENKSIVATCSDRNTQVIVYTDNFNYNIFFALPVSKLGKRYLVSTCHNDGDSTLIVIATHDQRSDVNITRYHEPDHGTFRRSDTTFLRLSRYQTFTMKEDFDLSGTLILSSTRVAVFSGTILNGKVVSYTQMHPVEQLGQEYIVSVDDAAKYQLKITTGKTNTRVTFNNGHVESTDGVLLRNLSLNEDLYFKSNSTVNLVLCGVGGIRSITHIQPTSEFGKYRRPSLFPGDNVLKIFSGDVDLQSNYQNIAWKNIPGTRLWVGTTRLQNDTLLNIVLTGLVLVFREHKAYLLPPMGSSNEALHRHTEKEIYLLALSPSNPYITASTDSTSGHWKVTFPDVGTSISEGVNTKARDIPAGRRDVYVLDSNLETGKARKENAVLVEVDKNIQIHMSNFVKSSSPLPLSALGTKYIINCMDLEDVTEVLVVVTHDQKTEVSITLGNDSAVTHYGKMYTDGEKWTVILDEYEAFSIDSTTFCGTMVESDKPIAVFLETKHPPSTSISSMSLSQQMLPVGLNGKEYFVSVDNPQSYNVDATYSLHMYSESSTSVKFSDGNHAIVFSNHYEKQLSPNTGVFFTTTDPVPVFLCRKVTHQNETTGTCMVLPPTTLYKYDTILPINMPVQSTYKILCKQNTSVEVILQIGITSKQVLPVLWEVDQGSEFKVGTFRYSPSVEEFSFNSFFHVTSDHRCAVLGFDQYSIFNGGYDVITEIENGPETKGKGNDSQTSLALAIGASCGVIILLLVVVLAVSLYKWKRRRGRLAPKDGKTKSNEVLQDAGQIRKQNRSQDKGPFSQNNVNMAEDLRGTVKVSETFI